MTFSYFITGFNQREPEARLSEAQRLELAACLAELAGLQCTEIGVPAGVPTYHGDTTVPVLTLRLDFDTLPALECQLAEGGRLHRLAASAFWASLPLDQVSQQAMLRRRFMGSLGTGSTGSRGTGGAVHGCDYLVHYPGAAEDFNAWLRYYLGHHPQIMATYPKVRGVDVFTRVDWCDAMPWERVHHMQRNRLAFDTPADLLAALESPVRARMQGDHACFPAYSGHSRHYPMRVTRVGASLRPAVA